MVETNNPPPPTTTTTITINNSYQGSTHLEYCVPPLVETPKYHRNVKLDLVIFHLVLNIVLRRRCLLFFYIAHTILELGRILDQFASVILSIIEFYYCEILQDGLGFPGLERSLAISVLVRNSL